eukprot:2298844-Alexandrium_andersonii.AAC.1
MAFVGSPQRWREVLNGDDEPAAVQGFLKALASAAAEVLRQSGKEGVFLRQIADHRSPGADGE